MAVIASGLYFLTFEKALIDTLGESLEDEDHYAGLVTDSEVPNFDTHDFHADITAEISGGNYAQDTITATEVTVSPAGTLMFDHVDTLYDNGGSNDVTITNAMAQGMATTVSGTATDQLVYLLDFVTAASSTASTFTTQINALGAFTIDLTP